MVTALAGARLTMVKTLKTDFFMTRLNFLLNINLPIEFDCYVYRKVPKFSDAKKLCCNLPKIQTKRPNLRVFCQNDAIWNSKQ